MGRGSWDHSREAVFWGSHSNLCAAVLAIGAYHRAGCRVALRQLRRFQISSQARRLRSERVVEHFHQRAQGDAADKLGEALLEHQAL
jgi:hypothetical protein